MTSDGEVTADYLDDVGTISDNNINADAADDGDGVLDAGSPVSPTVNSDEKAEQPTAARIAARQLATHIPGAHADRTSELRPGRRRSATTRLIAMVRVMDTERMEDDYIDRALIYKYDALL